MVILVFFHVTTSLKHEQQTDGQSHFSKGNTHLINQNSFELSKRKYVCRDSLSSQDEGSGLLNTSDRGFYEHCSSDAMRVEQL